MKKFLVIPLLFSTSLYAAEANIGQICKASAAAMFGRDYKIMMLDKVKSGIAYVHYYRPSDDSRWAIKCKLMGDRVMWASDNADSIGRWRDHPLDSLIKYSVDGESLIITETYSDGSGSQNTYPNKDL